MVNGYNDLTEQECYSDNSQLMRLVPGNMIEDDFSWVWTRQERQIVAQKT